MKKLTILGSTGSIGKKTLQIVSENPHLFVVKALVARSNVELMTEQCQIFKPSWAAMYDKKAAYKLQQNLQQMNISTKILSGEQAACDLVALDEIDQVMAAIVGSSGLIPLLSAIRAGKQILLANKEALVICGHFFKEALLTSKAQILPVDSEHNAIFQILPINIQQQLGHTSLSLTKHGIDSIILTGSGGPLSHLPISSYDQVTPKQACKHPNWKMGDKISVDSATMMNKGLEYIEACWLFNSTNDIQIKIIIHPQSIIHSMVRYIDGNFLALLSSPDMKLPIAYAMAWPQRIKTKVKILDFGQINQLTFSKPDFQRYPCLKLAIESYKKGIVATIILNAANEIAVSAFLSGKILFTAIPAIITESLNSFSCQTPKNIEEVIIIDKLVRIHVTNLLSFFTI
ncbi:MAG: 1-deoxy-D-xylulose-5-phosphate reductoisomerase [Candidatus Dasytiphilus stammeri]